MMRTLTILTVVAALAYGGYWAAGRTALLRGVEAGADAARARGWTLDWAELSVAGFPNRLDTTAEGLSLRTPDGAWGVDAPEVQVLALSYRPNDLRLVAVPPLSVTTPAGPVAVEAETLRGAALLTLAAPPMPESATVLAEGLRAEGAELAVTLASGQASMREAEGEHAYDVALDLTALAVEGLPAPVPALLDAVSMDATAVLDGPLEDRPALAALTLRRASLAWDDVTAEVTGEIAVGPGGTPEGALTLSVANWRALLPLLAELGLPPAQVLLLAGGIAGLERDGRAEIPLTLSQGALRFGAIPLAPLPRLPVPYSP